jgi:hypothetical protein
MKIIGVRIVKGASARLETWFEAGDSPPDASFVVRSIIERAEPLSLIPASTVEREHASYTSIPPKLWRKGAIYVVPVLLWHRIGYERYEGSWRGSAPPKRIGGPPAVRLAVVR